jgi:hypothetical protein
MYYTPLREPLNAFDRIMLNNDKQSIESSRFNTEYIDASQFVNMMNNFCFSTLIKSELDTNRLITYVKDNFNENKSERNEKIKYVIKLYKIFKTFRLAFLLQFKNRWKI